jgi:tetratricopeptide (TPR) repeat protein
LGFVFLSLIIARSSLAEQRDAGENPTDNRVEEVIAALADPDPQKRQEAQKRLAQMGPGARQAIVLASRSEVPAIASAASELLLALPWYHQSDPIRVKQHLVEYGTSSLPDRIELISRLASEPNQAGVPALLRLVVEDPSEDVCWQIVSYVRSQDGPKALEQARKLDPAPQQTAATTLAGWAWLRKDRDKALAMFSSAVDIESRRPTYDDGELDDVYTVLCKAAIGQQRYADAAELRRQQAARIGLSRGFYPLPVHQLFVLHAKFGPLQGFEQDLQSFSEYTGDPQVLYALAKMSARNGRGLEALMWEQAARSASMGAETRLRVANFLSATDWPELARRELYALLGDADDPEAKVASLNARLLLAALAIREEDDRGVVEHYSAALALFEKVSGPAHLQQRRRDGRAGLFDTENLQMQIELRRARLAHAANEAPENVRVHLDRFMSLYPAAPRNSDVILNAHALLTAVGRVEDAANVFADAYRDARQQLSQDPDNPTLMNDLAWLCARCDQKLTEALDLAQRAVAAEPFEAAYIDTLAEVQFRLGNAAEAARLEARALELEPGDSFMTRQLERFRSGVNSKQ